VTCETSSISPPRTLTSGYSVFRITLFTPQATLFNDQDEQLITQFNSLNPDEVRVVRATWQDSVDSSLVWARAFPSLRSTPTRFAG
jgi:hypothetical protein